MHEKPLWLAMFNDQAAVQHADLAAQMVDDHEIVADEQVADS
jgi:hypothetical protein